MLPLTGIRVVTMALNVPGPVAAARLRSEGAAIVKIEPPTGDPLEHLCPSWYRELHEGIRVERLDLKTLDGLERMRAHFSGAHLFLASQRPKALARLGLDPQSLIQSGAPTAHLRCLNIVGELAQPDVAGHDLTYVGRAGLIGAEIPRTLTADVLGGERAFSAMLLLLRQPPGSCATIGLFDSLAPLVAPRRHGLTDEGGPLGGGLPAYAIYRARDGRVAVAALEPHFRARLYDELGLAPEADLAAVFVERSADEWERWAREHDLPLIAIR